MTEKRTVMVNPLDADPKALKTGSDRRDKNRKTFMEWIRDNLKEGIDYGSISSTSKSGKKFTGKPSLWKPGSEKIIAHLGLVPTFPSMDKYEEMAYSGIAIENVIIRCEILTVEGQLVGVGIGGRTLKQQYGDLNACLKMACKSAQVDATLRICGLSESFTQDLEDMGIKKTNNQSHPYTTPLPKPVKKMNSVIDDIKILVGKIPKDKRTDYSEWNKSKIGNRKLADLEPNLIKRYHDDLLDFCNELSVEETSK